MECEIRGATDIAELQTMLDEWLVTVADRRVFEDRHVGVIVIATDYEGSDFALSVINSGHPNCSTGKRVRHSF